MVEPIGTSGAPQGRNNRSRGTGRHNGGRPPGMMDVARRAGVSHQTVSRVLNDPGSVRPQTLDKVRAAISELGYRRNMAARALAILLRFVVEWILALAAFWMVRTDGLNSLYFAVATLLSGAFAPLDRLPGWMRTTSEFTPFPYFLGHPLEIFTARTEPRDGLRIIMVQLAMIVVFGALGRLTYKRAVRHYEGVSS